MIIDGLLLFGSAQNVTTGTAASTNVIDLRNARDMGIGTPLQVAAYVTTAFATADAATLTIAAQGSTDNVTFTTYAQSRPYSAAELTLGAKLFPISWPHRSVAALPRYIRLAFIAGALNFTPGAITSMLVLDRQDDTLYPAGLTIAN